MKVTESQVIEASKLPSATQAAASLGIQYDTYRRYAKKLGVWKTNQSGKGQTKNRDAYRIPTQQILEGNHPHFTTYRLKHRLFNEGIKDNKCEMCGLSEWNGVQIALELDHVNGDSYDHRLENLRILCPNCHATTDTYRGKNKRSLGGIGIHD